MGFLTILLLIILSFFSLGNLFHSNNRSSCSRNNLHDIIDRVLPSDSSESEILDLTMGSRKRSKNTWQNYGSVREIPTAGKNNLPIGGKVANAFCYHEEASRAATPSQTNPNVMFYRRSNSVMASSRSINQSGGRSHIGKHDDFALF